MKEIFDLISSIVESVAWPFSVIVIVVFLRSPISELLARLGKFKYGKFEAEFTEGMEDVKVSIEESKKKGSFLSGSADVVVNYNKPLSLEVEEIAKTSPKAAIPFAWSKIEYALNEKSKQLKIDKNEDNIIQPQRIATQLLKDEKISSSIYNAINTMRQLRNFISHNHCYSSELTLKNAIEYGKNAEFVIQEINSIS